MHTWLIGWTGKLQVDIQLSHPLEDPRGINRHSIPSRNIFNGCHKILITHVY
jgi:hypothetical protein